MRLDTAYFVENKKLKIIKKIIVHTWVTVHLPTAPLKNKKRPKTQTHLT